MAVNITACFSLPYEGDKYKRVFLYMMLEV